tara:strand:- start:464 stop:751 length:288 start_codon:yes stop_codon:yes gene_type:complete
MNATALSLVAVLDACQKVEDSTLLNDPQKYLILHELENQLAPEMLSSGCLETRKIVSHVLITLSHQRKQKFEEEKVVAAKKRTQKKATKRANPSK